MFNSLYNFKDIITYLKKSYFIKKVIFFSCFFLILISLNAVIISNLIYYHKDKSVKKSLFAFLS